MPAGVMELADGVVELVDAPDLSSGTFEHEVGIRRHRVNP